MEYLNILMEQVVERENKGENKAAALILVEAANEAAITDKDLYTEIIYELAMLYFRTESYYSALVNLIEISSSNKSDEILSFIFEAYIVPNRMRYQKNYEDNIKSLIEYPFLYSDHLPKFEDISFDIVWEDSEVIIYYVNGKFIGYKILNEYVLPKEDADKVFIVIKDFSTKNLLDLEQKNKRYDNYLSQTIYELNPIYLYYNSQDFLLFLSINLIEEMIEKERFVFLIGLENTKEFFDDFRTKLPTRIIQRGDREIAEKLKDLIKERYRKEGYILGDGKEKLIHYYGKEKEKEIMERIQLGRPKILFHTSRLTTALQYHIKNFYHAAVKKGIEADLAIENSTIHTMSRSYFLNTIDKKKPDIIVTADHFRFEFFDILDLTLPSLFFLTWVQDPLDNIIDKRSPYRLLKNDFLLNHFITWNEFYDIGYNVNKLIDAPVPSNQDVYKPYNLSETEKDRYGCDICMVNHSAVIYDFIEEERNAYDSVLMKDVISNMYLNYYRQVLEREEIYFTKQEFMDYVMRYFTEVCNISITDEECDILTETLFLTYAPKVYRQVMVEWILDAGYNNIKLWGNDWGKYEKFTPYAMGTAENGEILSKILQASKIVIGNNNICTAVARAWETMLSGGFYLSNYVPEEADSVDIRKILKPEDYVMFHSKSELLEKIDYYLSHEIERLDMAEKGRKKALDKMTFDALLDHTLRELKEKIS